MNFRPPNMIPQDNGAALADLESRWRALRAAADAVLMLSGEPIQPGMPADLRHFPTAIAALTGGRRRLVDEGLSDLVAIMEPGLAALLAVHERGGNVAVPAKALWHEFVSARDMLVAITLDQPE